MAEFCAWLTQTGKTFVHASKNQISPVHAQTTEDEDEWAKEKSKTWWDLMARVEGFRDYVRTRICHAHTEPIDRANCWFWQDPGVRRAPNLFQTFPLAITQQRWDAVYVRLFLFARSTNGWTTGDHCIFCIFEFPKLSSCRREPRIRFKCRNYILKYNWAQAHVSSQFFMESSVRVIEYPSTLL